MSFELKDIRDMSTKKWGEIKQKTMQDLPSDLKSKRPFRVTKVTAEFITIKKTAIRNFQFQLEESSIFIT